MIKVKNAIFMKDEVKYIYEIDKDIKVVFKGNGGTKTIPQATIQDVIDMDKETRNIKEVKEVKEEKPSKKGKNNE